MKVIGILLIIIGIVSGLLGVRSYMRDGAYAKASVVVKSSVKWAEVKPNPWKSTVSIKLMLSYIRDGVPDSLEHNYSQFYSKDEPLPTIEKLKAAPPYVRYVPEEKKSEKIPNWVLVSNNGEFEGLYGRSLFVQMFTFILLGIMVRMFFRKKQVVQKPLYVEVKS